ncbi:unnamed protein product, partial [Urochloa humidicola]
SSSAAIPCNRSGKVQVAPIFPQIWGAPRRPPSSSRGRLLPPAAPSQAPLRPLVHRLLVLAGRPLRLLLRRPLAVHVVAPLPAAPVLFRSSGASLSPRPRRLRWTPSAPPRTRPPPSPGCHGEKQGAPSTSPAAPAPGRDAPLPKWAPQEPLAGATPPSNRRPHQPSEAVRKVVFGGQVTEEAVSLNKRKPLCP